MKGRIYKKVFFVSIILIIISLCFSVFKVNAKNNISADGYIVMETSSKRVLMEKNKDKRYLTASICKILTAIIAIENSHLDDYVLVNKDSINQIGSKVYLKENDMISVEDLLYGLLLRSGNDCAYLLALNTCSSITEFSLLMNEYAKRIGMVNSTFCNPSGLDDENLNYSTPYDMALLMTYCMNNETFRKISSTKVHTSITSESNNLYFYNKHKLVQSYDYIISGKTGYTEKAGRTLISYSEKDNMNLVCVTFKANSDWNDHLYMFNKVYDEYEMKKVFSKKIIEASLSYTPYLEKDIYLPMRREENVDVSIYLLKNTSEKKVGVVYIYSSNQLIYKDYVYRYY